MPKDEKDNNMRIFDAYLAKEMPESFPQFLKKFQGDFWNGKTIPEDDKVKPFADIDMCLEKTPCYEVFTERAISP